MAAIATHVRCILHVALVRIPSVSLSLSINMFADVRSVSAPAQSACAAARVRVVHEICMVVVVAAATLGRNAFGYKVFDNKVLFNFGGARKLHLIMSS